MIRAIQGGFFDDEKHEYADADGKFVPSCTQIISLVKYSNFDGIPEHVVANAGRRGGNCHWLTEVYDTEGDVPPPWTPREEIIRFEGYRKWKDEKKFIPDKVEYPTVVSVYGMKYGVTLDRTGTIDGQKAIVELKFTYSPSKSWGPQTASQEMALTGSATIGQYLRVVCHVDSKGKHNTIYCRDPQDAQRFIFALGVVWTRIDMGQNVRKEILGLGVDDE